MANETPSGTGASADLADISFEDALRELEAIVDSLEHGDVSLDDAIAAFERGTALKAHCQARLEEARMPDGLSLAIHVILLPPFPARVRP